MNEQELLNYRRVEAAIAFIGDNFRRQPSLDEIAAHVSLSPAHFQRLFSDWAGTSPKKFLQYISLGHAKELLKDKSATLFDATLETGLSSTSRLHDLFISIEGMTPAEYRNGGKSLVIRYSFHPTLFGNVLVASTEKGVCHIAFDDSEENALAQLGARFPMAAFISEADLAHTNALRIFYGFADDLPQVKLHLKGSEFQLKVWEALLKIPAGELSTYGKLASGIGQPSASRAVGTAIGSNPVAFLIPCHRVIQSTGHFGGYMWGPARKAAIIGWESAKVNAE
jgi:AraC family transcriptional regulator, regulatory protein of adaptative response / methylated-DNA-[protein]-cysteine methyltransferase